MDIKKIIGYVLVGLSIYFAGISIQSIQNNIGVQYHWRVILFSIFLFIFIVGVYLINPAIIKKYFRLIKRALR